MTKPAREITEAEANILAEIKEIMEEYRRQEKTGIVDSPGGLEHMGDVWKLLASWDAVLATPEGS